MHFVKGLANYTILMHKLFSYFHIFKIIYEQPIFRTRYIALLKFIFEFIISFFFLIWISFK